jgi:type IV secretion system protein VirB5
MNSNPYVEARREWDERYADLVLGKRNWQITAGGLLLLSLILAAGVVWQSTRSRFIPYVVEVDKLGYGLTVPKPLIPSTDPALVDRMERYEVASFIRNSRSVSSDPSAEQHMLSDSWRMRKVRQTNTSTSISTPTTSRTIPSRRLNTKQSRYKSIPFSSSPHTVSR